jgi:hypothetical protein
MSKGTQYAQRLAKMQQAAAAATPVVATPVAATPAAAAPLPPHLQWQQPKESVPPPLQALPKKVFDRLVFYLRWDSILHLSSTSKYFHDFLIHQYPGEFFLLGPVFLPPQLRTNGEVAKKSEIDRLHPIFNHLHFTHRSIPNAVRVRNSFGQFLACLKVKTQFATRPAVTELVIEIHTSRNLGGVVNKHGKSWSGVCTVQNKNGIKVWDLIVQLLTL